MKTFFIWILLYPVIAFTQTMSDYGRSYSDTIPKKYILDVAKLREHIYAGVPGSLKKDWHEVMTYRFADENAYRISNLMASGQVYSDWIPLENYLNDILNKVMPKELRQDSMIHAYVIQDGNYNAFMTPSGYTFINVGLLAEVPNEAAIAGILAHELAHYYLKHALYKFVQAETGEFDQGLFSYSDKPFYTYSQTHELQADSLAIRWLQNSGYNLNGFISSFEIQRRLEKNKIKRLENEWKLKETTHPLSAEREKRLNKFYEKYKNDTAKYFLINEIAFHKFQDAAKPEILKIHLNSFEYYSCIEKSFRFHIFDPNNSVYVYYLMESIRRNCYLDVELWSKMFITNRYYDTLLINDIPRKEKMKNNLFKKFDFDIIPIDPADGMKIKAKYYWKESPQFTTYEEAFNYFYRLSQLLNNHECVLSNALSYTSDTIARNKLLEKYLSYNDIKYKVYAQNLHAGLITSCLTKNKILVFHDFRITVRQGEGDLDIPTPEFDKAQPLSQIFDSLSLYASKKKYAALFMLTIKNNKCNDYKMLSELEKFSFFPTISKVLLGEKTELQILDPRYWETLHKYNVNEIEFINCTYFESHPKAKTMDNYKSISDADYSSFFSKTPSTKYLYVYLSSIRQIPGKAMKTRFFNGVDNINSTESTADQIVSTIRYELKAKTQRINDLDYWNVAK